MFSVIFPGQGSQKVGMAKDLYDKYTIVKELFNEADDILSFPISKLIFEGPKEDLDKTINTQPSIFLVGYSIFQLVKKEFLVKKPKGFSTKEAMILGTAGFTSLLCAFAVKAREEILLGEKVNEVLVTGETGGVGSIAVMVLSKLGYNVSAVTGKKKGSKPATGPLAASLLVNPVLICASLRKSLNVFILRSLYLFRGNVSNNNLQWHLFNFNCLNCSTRRTSRRCLRSIIHLRCTITLLRSRLNSEAS